jgi:ribulose 1,5-bisphosphate carboxylase large subunit-like protein
VIRLTYRIETPGSVEAMATKIASDQSTGTFVALPGETEELKARVAARVVAIRPLPPTDRASFPDEAGGATVFNRADVDIDFPMDAVGTDLSALMTIAIGGVFSIKGMTGIRIVGMQLPQDFAVAHPGPQFGVAGSFALTGVKDRPIIGTIVKPALGLRPHETAEMVGELIAADVDFIKDDEKLMSPAYSPLKDRVAAIMPKILDHEQKTGKKVMYAFGISHADPDEMMRNHDLVLAAGGNCAVVNINSIGFGGMAFLRKRSGLVLHAHRNGWDIFTRHAGLGFEFSVWQQFWRLLGVDQFPDQRHPGEILGTGRKFRALVQGGHDTAVFRRRRGAAGHRFRPMGRAGARYDRRDRRLDGPALSLRRRYRQPPGRAGGGGKGGPAGLGGGGRGRATRNLCEGPSGTRTIHR